LGAITGTADIRAASGAPRLENILVKTKDNAGIEVDLSGRIAVCRSILVNLIAAMIWMW